MMSQIIPRNLIKHLEWNPSGAPAGSSPPPQNPTPPQSPNQGNVILKAELAKYIQVGINGIHGQPVVISPYELDDFNNKTYDDTHVKLIESDLYMPTPKIFRTHFNNVVAAHKGERNLLHADGTQVHQGVVTEMFRHMTQAYIDIYKTGQGGVWTWLNARFVKGDGHNELDLETVVGIGKKKGKFEVDKVKLAPYLISDCFVDLSFNNQGLSSSRSPQEKYKKGENIYFYYPRKDCVARFVADSDRANLYCYGNPSDSYASLGVFGCAEGASAQNSGGSSR